MLPLVCKAFAAACRGPSHLWKQLSIDAGEHAALTGGRLLWARANRWIAERAVSVTELRLVPKHAIPAGRLVPLWAALGSHLRILELQLDRELPLASKQDDLHALSKLTVLEQLTLTGPAAPSSRVSAGLVAGIAPLTQLQTLTLKLRACPFTMLRPDLPPILLGSLVNLRKLDIDLASFAPPPNIGISDGSDTDEDAAPPSPKTAAGNNMLPDCITRLTRLQDLRLSGDWRRPQVTLPADFAQLVALRSMRLDGLYLGPSTKRAPCALTTLVLKDCLGDFPFSSDMLSLITLRLEACDDMHLAASSLQALQEVPRLDATVIIRDSQMMRLPRFLDAMPPTTRLISKPNSQMAQIAA